MFVQAIFRLVEDSTDVLDWEVERVVLGHHQEIWGLAAHPTRWVGSQGVHEPHAMTSEPKIFSMDLQAYTIVYKNAVFYDFN